jgi:pantetheine-phosphate adenylyltransferase
MQKIAIYAGTFDPITFGHIDIIERAATIFDKIVVVIGVNPTKKNLFNENERKIMAEKSLKYLKNVEILVHHGLTVEIARKYKAIAMIRGVRAVSDFDYEFQIALANRKIENEIHTIFMMPDEKYSYLSSSVVRELASYGEDVSSFVPAFVAEELSKKFNFSNKKNEIV